MEIVLIFLQNISINDIKMSENKTTLYDLNNDCIQQIIRKLSLKDMFIAELFDKRFELCVEEVLKQRKVIRFGNFEYCTHSANNSQIY